jgi:hypothetical protein
MKHSNRTIWAVALGITACGTLAQADSRKPPAPVVQLPPNTEAAAASGPLIGPAVNMPFHGSVEVASAAPEPAAYTAPVQPPPKVAAQPLKAAPTPRRGVEAGPVVTLPQQ